MGLAQDVPSALGQVNPSMFIISKRFSFCAAHHLSSLPPGHKCRRTHGHNYEVEVILHGKELDDHGFVREFDDLDSFQTFIDENLDHRDLCDLRDLPSASTENLARYLYVAAHLCCKEVVAVRIHESPKLSAMYVSDQASRDFMDWVTA